MFVNADSLRQSSWGHADGCACTSCRCKRIVGEAYGRLLRPWLAAGNSSGRATVTIMVQWKNPLVGNEQHRISTRYSPSNTR
eukprot:s3119_g3.t1